MTDQTLQVSSPDFDDIKNNFIDYLKNKSEFSDYVFEGSAIQYLMDILAYNTFYNVTHTNMGFAETFLDSAVLRGSVVSRAKELGYTPRSMSAATASITLSFVVTGNPSQYIVPKNTRFSSTDGSNNFVFTTTEDIIFTNVGNVFTKTISITQGSFSTYSYTVDGSNPLQRFIIPSKNADTQHLTVSYLNSVSDTDPIIVEYYKNIELGNISGDTSVYLLQESYDGYFQLVFGDDTVGRSVKSGNIINIDYLITNGSSANGLKNFSLASSLTNVSNVTIVTVSSAIGGDDKESVDRIKYLAPFYYQAQDRAATEDDYKAIIVNTYSDIEDIAVWGGEKNDPPYYGKVFVAIKPKGNITFSTTKKQQIENDIIKKYNIVGIRPQIVDPDYIYVYVNTVVTYNGRLLNSVAASSLTSNVTQNIQLFFQNNVNKFAQPLYYSKLIKAIDSTSPLIVSSIVNLTLEKSLEISAGVNNFYKFSFNNAIYAGSMKSNSIIVDGVTWKMRDVPNGSGPSYTAGVIQVYRVDGQGNTFYLSTNAGTINYTTGTIEIPNLRVDAILNDPIGKLLVIQVSPGAIIDLSKEEAVHNDQNIYANGRDQIIVLQTNGIFVTTIPDNSV